MDLNAAIIENLQSQILDLKSISLQFIHTFEENSLATFGNIVPNTQLFRQYIQLCETIGHAPSLLLMDNDNEHKI